MFEDLLVNAHGRVERDDGFAVAFGFGQVHAQVGVFAPHDLDVAVLERAQVAGADEAVDHEARCPGHIRRKRLLFAADFVLQAYGAGIGGIELPAQTAGAAQNLPVFARRIGAARLRVTAQVWKGGKRFDQSHGQRLLEHFADHDKVLVDRGGRVLNAQVVNKSLQGLVVDRRTQAALPAR